MQYFFIQLKWNFKQQNQKQEEAEENKPTSPPTIRGNLFVTASCNIWELVELIQYDLAEEGLDVSWKPVQLMNSSVQLKIMAVDDRFCAQGVQQILTHWMEKAEEKLIREGHLSKDFEDVPLPPFSLYFQSQREAQLPRALWEKHKIVGYDDYRREEGVRMLTLECSPEDMPRIGTICIVMQKTGWF